MFEICDTQISTLCDKSHKWADINDSSLILVRSLWYRADKGEIYFIFCKISLNLARYWQIRIRHLTYESAGSLIITRYGQIFVTYLTYRWNLWYMGKISQVYLRYVCNWLDMGRYVYELYSIWVRYMWYLFDMGQIWLYLGDMYLVAIRSH